MKNHELITLFEKITPFMLSIVQKPEGTSFIAVMNGRLICIESNPDVDRELDKYYISIDDEILDVAIFWRDEDNDLLKKMIELETRAYFMLRKSRNNVIAKKHRKEFFESLIA